MVEDYRILQRFGHAQHVGIDRNGRRITRCMVFFRTPAGDMPREEWRDRLEAVVVQDGEGGLLEVIRRHCEQCPWLHTDDQVIEYALEILASRTFLCGSDAWREVEAEARSKGLVDGTMAYKQAADFLQMRKTPDPAEPVTDIVQEAGGQLRFA